MIKNILAWTIATIIFSGMLACIVGGAIFLSNNGHKLPALLWVLCGAILIRNMAKE